MRGWEGGAELAHVHGVWAPEEVVLFKKYPTYVRRSFENLRVCPACTATASGGLPGTSPVTALCGRRPPELAGRVIAPHARASRSPRRRRG